MLAGRAASGPCGAATVPARRVQHVVARADRDTRRGQGGLQLLELGRAPGRRQLDQVARAARVARRQPAVERRDEGQRRPVAVDALDDPDHRERRAVGELERGVVDRLAVGEQAQLVGRRRGDRDLVGRARRTTRGQLGSACEERVLQVGELDDALVRRWAGRRRAGSGTAVTDEPGGSSAASSTGARVATLRGAAGVGRCRATAPRAGRAGSTTTPRPARRPDASARWPRRRGCSRSCTEASAATVAATIGSATSRQVSRARTLCRRRSRRAIRSTGRQ